jgi:choline dehydrogenase-like flavoprotein
VLWPSNFGTDIDWAYRTTPQVRAAGRIIDWPRGKVIGGSSSINAMIWVWGAAADFDQWAYAGCQGWDYGRLESVFQSIETCARKSLNSDRGTKGPMHVEPVADPNPLSAGFFEACEEMGHQVLEDVGAPVRDGAGYVDFNTKDGQRFSVVHGYLLPALGPDLHAVLATAAVGTTEVRPNEGFSIRLGLLRPRSRGRIKITSADLNAPLLIDPNYFSAEADLTALCAAVEHSRAIGSAAGLSEWRKREIARIPLGKRELKEFVARNVGSYWHSVGTCAMGVHQEAVVDPSLCVYGTTSLRVADASIMPTITSGDTNAPTIVIAERAAQMIKGTK